MSLLKQNRIAPSTQTEYATREDYCKLFAENEESLYLLSFLLTVNREKADQCVVTGLGDCVEGNFVFKEWANSWARRIIIRSAIRLMAPRPSYKVPALIAVDSVEVDNLLMQLQDTALAGVLTLADFDRFVFVLTVLEKYSEQNCALLLGATHREVKESRERALQHIADSAGNTFTPESGYECMVVH